MLRTPRMVAAAGDVRVATGIAAPSARLRACASEATSALRLTCACTGLRAAAEAEAASVEVAVPDGTSESAIELYAVASVAVVCRISTGAELAGASESAAARSWPAPIGRGARSSTSWGGEVGAGLPRPAVRRLASA